MNRSKNAQPPLGSVIRSTCAIAKLGEFMGATSQKSSSDWKARMLKAGLASRGLIMPDNWDELPEDEKQRRLDAVIKIGLEDGP